MYTQYVNIMHKIHSVGCVNILRKSMVFLELLMWINVK